MQMPGEVIYLVLVYDSKNLLFSCDVFWFWSNSQNLPSEDNTHSCLRWSLHHSFVFLGFLLDILDCKNTISNIFIINTCFDWITNIDFTILIPDFACTIYGVVFISLTTDTSHDLLQGCVSIFSSNIGSSTILKEKLCNFHLVIMCSNLKWKLFMHRLLECAHMHHYILICCWACEWAGCMPSFCNKRWLGHDQHDF